MSECICKTKEIKKVKTPFKILAKHKFVENLLSIKVWVIFSVLGISTGLVLLGKLDGVTWASINGGVVSTVLALREAVKISKIKSDDDTTEMMV